MNTANLTALTRQERKEFIKKIWILFRTEGTHSVFDEYIVLVETLMSEYSIKFKQVHQLTLQDLENFSEPDVRTWFFDMINTDAMADNFRDFFNIAVACLDFSKYSNPFKLCIS